MNGITHTLEIVLAESNSGSSTESGENSAKAPSGEPDGGNTPPEKPSGKPGGAQTFTAGDETLTADISDAAIVKDSETIEADDIAVGNILRLTFDDGGKVKSVIVISLESGSNGGFGGSGTVTQGDSANTLSEDGTYSGKTYSSSGDDENALRIDGAAVTLTDITVDKSAGATSNTENGDFYGVNAALLATNGAVVTIKNATVKSSAQNGNGVFSYGSGTVSVTGGSYTSGGYNSPAVYPTADITVSDATLTANNSETLVIEGKNSITLKNCTVTGNMSDTKGTSSDENVHNVMIYQSMCGDADVGTSTFSMTGGSLTSQNVDMFYITNTHCVMTLSGVNLTNKDADAYLMRVSGNSASHGWGTAGSNGAQVEFTADAQKLNGNIIVDTVSTLKMALKNGSVFTGALNITDNAQNGTAVSNNVAVTIESGCTWNLTGNCTLTSLTNNATVNFNGYTITLADGTVLKYKT